MIFPYYDNKTNEPRIKSKEEEEADERFYQKLLREEEEQKKKPKASPKPKPNLSQYKQLAKIKDFAEIQKEKMAKSKSPPSTPKPATPKPTTPKPDTKYKQLAKIEEFITDTETYLSKKSTRAFNALMKKYDDKDFVKAVLEAQLFSDLYPTSQKCLSHYKNYIRNFDDGDIIIEPTAGLGSIVLWLLNNKVESKIITTDFDPILNDYLKESFDNINNVNVLSHIKSNYLKLENDFHRYNPSVIFLNPPFTSGGDKKYYLNFLFKAIYDLKMSDHPYKERQLFFISTQLTKSESDGDTFNFDEIIISKNKKAEIKEMLNIDEDEYEDLRPLQSTRVSMCRDFAGTNVEAVLYHMIIY